MQGLHIRQNVKCELLDWSEVGQAKKEVLKAAGGALVSKGITALLEPYAPRPPRHGPNARLGGPERLIQPRRGCGPHAFLAKADVGGLGPRLPRTFMNYALPNRHSKTLGAICNTADHSISGLLAT